MLTLMGKHTCDIGLLWHPPTNHPLPKESLLPIPHDTTLAVQSSPMWLLGSLFSRQGSSRPDGALILAVSVLRSVSLMSRRKSAAEPSFTWEQRLLSSEKKQQSSCYTCCLESTGYKALGDVTSRIYYPQLYDNRVPLTMSVHNDHCGRTMGGYDWFRGRQGAVRNLSYKSL